MALRVMVAPDSFGTTLTAAQAAKAIARGWSSVRPDDDVIVKPQSDGGPGFIDCLVGVGRQREATVTGPLGVPVMARWRVDACSAYVESAQACGLHLIERPSPASALRARTTGVGELIAAALWADPIERLIVGLGGSASTDGGRGLLNVLGGLDGARARLHDREIIVATDVDNPLTGTRGAAVVFAPQKGADRRGVDLLSRRLARWGSELDAFARRAVSTELGAGAAGGVGAALFALGATRASGADLVAQLTGLSELIGTADIVITGEGRLDEQTVGGKVVARVAAAASDRTPVLALVGQCTLADPQRLGLTAVHSLVEHAGQEMAVAEAGEVLTSLAAQVAGNTRGWSTVG